MEQQKKKSTLRDFVEAFLIALAIALPTKYFIASPFIVRQTSMFPTFKDGDYLIVDKLSYRWNSPQRGEVIVFKPPFSDNTYYIKRIIALPGETIDITGSVVKITNKDNPEGFTLDEKYTSSSRVDNVSMTLGPTEYFVMGDNRAASSDSRSWGPLTYDHISGKAVMRLFPINSIDYMPGSTEKI
jgi:signal peptidase I